MNKLIVSCFAALAGWFLFALTALADTVEISSGDETLTFEVEMADEPEEITRGLMFRENLDPNAGMLFDFGAPREANMWMKNVSLSLDMLFLSPEGEILAIARNAVPGSVRTINPGVPVKGVLEINGGRAAELGIEPGDTVAHPMFSPAEDD